MARDIEQEWKKNPVVAIRNRRTAMKRESLIFVAGSTDEGQAMEKQIKSDSFVHKFYEKGSTNG